MKELTYLLLLVVAYFVYMNFIRKTFYLTSVKASTGEAFLVRNIRDKQVAANKLGDLSETLRAVCEACEAYQSDQAETVSKDRRKGIERLLDNFDSHKLTENIPGSSHVAYSVNKGSEMSICLREPETHKFIDTNTVRFVAIHELAHVMSQSSGHTDEFWDNMDFLLQRAMSRGLYTPVDYSKSPVSYCGIEITDTPLTL
jgi:hypothetical protein